jgi:hypothetical protein
LVLGVVLSLVSVSSSTGSGGAGLNGRGVDDCKHADNPVCAAAVTVDVVVAAAVDVDDDTGAGGDDGAGDTCGEADDRDSTELDETQAVAVEAGGRVVREGWVGVKGNDEDNDDDDDEVLGLDEVSGRGGAKGRRPRLSDSDVSFSDPLRADTSVATFVS